MQERPCDIAAKVIISSSKIRPQDRSISPVYIRYTQWYCELQAQHVAYMRVAYDHRSVFPTKYFEPDIPYDELEKQM